MNTEPVIEDRPTTRRRWLKPAGATALGAVGGAVVAASPAMAAGSSFFPVTFRSFDSRPGGRPLFYGEYFDIDLITDQGGNPRLPPSTIAVTYNLTVTATGGTFGYLAMWAAGQGNPGTSSINWWAPDLTLANGGTTTLGTSSFSGPGSVTILCLGQPTARTHGIIDVTGYYLPI